MEEGKPLIVIDNTNIKLWEMKNYVIAGEQRGYAVRIEEPETPWAFSYRQCAKKNAHGVPEETCKRMRDNFEVCKRKEEVEMKYEESDGERDDEADDKGEAAQ